MNESVPFGSVLEIRINLKNKGLTQDSAGVNGGRALRLPVNPVDRTKITRSVTWDANEKTAFIDFQMKPAADPTGSSATFSVNGTQLAFQVPAGSTQGEIWVLNGGDNNGTPNVNPASSDDSFHEVTRSHGIY